MKSRFILYLSLISAILHESEARNITEEILNEYKGLLGSGYDYLTSDPIMTIYIKIDRFLDVIGYSYPGFKGFKIIEPIYFVSDALVRSLAYSSGYENLLDDIEKTMKLSGFKFSLFMSSYMTKYYENIKPNNKIKETE